MAHERIRVSFSSEVYAFIVRDAARCGVSVSEYVGTAAFARAVAGYVRANPDGAVMWDELHAAAQRVAFESDTLDPD